VREAEEYPLLEAAARERLVKTQQARTGLAGAVVICELRSELPGNGMTIEAEEISIIKIRYQEMTSESRKKTWCVL
jgi:hypothetical protein